MNFYFYFRGVDEGKLMINYYSKMLASEHEGKRRGGGTFFLSYMYIYNVLYKLHVRKFVSFDKLRLTFSSYQFDKGYS